MAQDERDNGHITDFERAVCYYTLPRVAHPVTFGLIIAYAVCLFEAVGVWIYGAIWDNETYARAGLIAVVGIVVFGVIIFLARAFLVEFRSRRALAAAGGVGDADADADGLPDPFANHVLLRFHRPTPSGATDITDNAGNLKYTVSGKGQGHTWTVKDAQSETEIALDGRWGGRSFFFDAGAPMAILVYRGDEEIARIQRRRGFRDPVVDIACREPDECHFVARGTGFYKADRLVGRVYRLRGYTFLDVEKDCFNEGILSFYVSMT